MTIVMTFEEIQQAIQQMFAVQRELQESQLRLAEQMAEQRVEHERRMADHDRRMADHDRRMADHDQWISNFRQLFQDLGERQIRMEAEQDRQERILNQLIGYSLANETDHLNLEEHMMRLEKRIEQIRGT